jgi:hypothetical protein
MKTEKEKTAGISQSKKEDHQNTMPPGKNRFSGPITDGVGEKTAVRNNKDRGGI